MTTGGALLEEIRHQIRLPEPETLLGEWLGEHLDAVRKGRVTLTLFCAGSSGRILVPFLVRAGLSPACIGDNDPARSGQSIAGVPVVDFETFRERYRESLVLIASAAYQHPIRRQLLEVGFAPENVITLDSASPDFEAQLRRESLLMLARNGEASTTLEGLDPAFLGEAYDLLADEKSRRLFIARLALVASGYEYRTYREYLETYSEPLLASPERDPRRWNRPSAFYYFTNDVLRMREGEICVDGGAFTGDTAELFIQACAASGVDYGAVHAFEPDAGNFAQLERYAAFRRRISCVNRGLWSSQATLRFISSAHTEAYGARLQDEGAVSDCIVETASLDEYLEGRPATLIKLDVEGAEQEALRGAAHTLREYHPQLAISVYHQTRDLVEIPRLIQALAPGYRFYLRHLGHYFDDLILFATTDTSREERP